MGAIAKRIDYLGMRVNEAELIGVPDAVFKAVGSGAIATTGTKPGTSPIRAIEAISTVLGAIPAILTTISQVLTPIGAIFQLIPTAAVMPCIPAILAAIASIFQVVGAVLAAVKPVLAKIPVLSRCAHSIAPIMGLSRQEDPGGRHQYGRQHAGHHQPFC
jgi:hypothetical protein